MTTPPTPATCRSSVRPSQLAIRTKPATDSATACNAGGQVVVTVQFSSQPAAMLDSHRYTPVSMAKGRATSGCIECTVYAALAGDRKLCPVRKRHSQSQSSAAGITAPRLPGRRPSASG